MYQTLITPEVRERLCFPFTLTLHFQELPSFLARQPKEISETIKPGEFILWMNVYSELSYWFIATMLISFLISEILCITLIYLILSILHANAALFSRNTYKLHFQFTVLLAVQLLTPFVFILLPITLCLIAALFDRYSPQFAGQMGFIMITLYGMANALFTILFVGPYRAHAYRKLVFPVLRRFFKISVVIPKGGTVSAVSSTMMSSQRISSPDYRRRSRSQSLYASRGLN
jgi:hypothetical protein